MFSALQSSPIGLPEGVKKDLFDTLGVWKEPGSRESSRFIKCVFKIHERWPEVVDKYANSLLFNLPSLHGVCLCVCACIYVCVCVCVLCVRAEDVKKTLFDTLGVWKEPGSGSSSACS